MAEEGYKIPKKTVWATTANYKRNATISHLSGSGGHLKLTPEMLGVIEEQIEANNETTVSQLV